VSKAPPTSELRQARRELEIAQARFRAAGCGTDPEATWQAGERLHHARRKVALLGREQAMDKKSVTTATRRPQGKAHLGPRQAQDRSRASDGRHHP